MRWKLSSPVAEERLEVDDELLLLIIEVASLDPRPEVVGPPKPAALAAPHQPCTTPTKPVNWILQLQFTRTQDAEPSIDRSGEGSMIPMLQRVPVFVGTARQFPGPCSWM